ncbi:Uncharacterized protein GBIM_20685, partial [Gryllus bimaculatus]
MLPDPDANAESVATPAERGTTADPTVLAEASKLSPPGTANAALAPPASTASAPRACSFSTRAPVAQEHRQEALEEHQQPTPLPNLNTEYQTITADGFRNHNANAAVDVESVFLETCQSSDDNCVPSKEETTSSTTSASPDGRRLTDGFDESDLQYLEDEGPDVVDFFRVLIGEGRLKPGDCGVSLDSKPAWVDDEKVRLGQQFAQKYFFGLVFAEMISLFLLFSLPGSLHSLIFSGNSDTPFKAFRRYLSTVSRVRAWYRADLWAAEGEARRHLRAVRQLHALYRRRLNELNGAPADERARRTALRPPLWTRGAADAVREDFADGAHAAATAAAAAAGCPFF